MDKIKREMKDALACIKNEEAKRKILMFFDEDVKRFNQTMNGLEKEIKSAKTSLDEACSIVSRSIKHIIKKGNELEEVVKDNVAVKKIKHMFRDEIRECFINKSYLIRWACDKPSGFPGDYKLIEMLYDKLPRSESVGFCGDKYILHDDYVEAVRARKDMMKKLLEEFIGTAQKRDLSIMNFGCGSVREISELFSVKNFDKKIMFTLVDWDNEALEFSKNVFDNLGHNSKLDFKCVRKNVIDFCRYPDACSKELKKQDLIYSIGLADYLTSGILKEIIKFCFNLLKKDGSLMIAHKNVKLHKSLASDWFCDWSFYPRSKQDIKTLVSNNLSNDRLKMKVIDEDSERIFFIVITKTA